MRRKKWDWTEKKTNVICKEEVNLEGARLQTEKHQNVKEGKSRDKIKKMEKR